jgi:DegV family protein with EDD domain
MTVKILTDSVADLPDGTVRQLGITVVPIILRWGEQVYRDGIDLTAEEFYEKLKLSKLPPTTSLPSPGVFAETYNRLAEETDEILVITVTSRLSGTCDIASTRAGLVKRGCRVEVVDSRSATMAEGFLVIKAARAAQSGAGLDYILQLLKREIDRVDFLSTFDTLEYLKRGGRIGKAQAFLGSMLKINPLITLRQGVVEPAGRVHSRSRAINRLVEFARSYDTIEELAIQSATTPHEADEIAERIGDRFPRQRMYFTRPTPVIGAHTGPGFLLVAVMGDKAVPEGR